MELEARAKINWTLDIVGQRADGYHLMDMLMQPITLADTIMLTPADTLTLSTSGTPLMPADQTNLAWRAGDALRRATGYAGGAAISVHKRIPSGAGLGGGSADAAGVLWGLNQLWDTGLDQQQLEAIGLTLGADVPFCLRGGLARVTGIGEQMESLQAPPSWPLLIIQPCDGLSTGAVFKAYHNAGEAVHPRTEAALQALIQGDLDGLTPSLGNALEAVSRQMRPAIGQAIEALLDSGAVAARMSGSGSAVFGVFREEATAARAFDVLRSRWDRTFLCRTCTESVVQHD